MIPLVTLTYSSRTYSVIIADARWLKIRLRSEQDMKNQRLGGDISGTIQHHAPYTSTLHVLADRCVLLSCLSLDDSYPVVQDGESNAVAARYDKKLMYDNSTV